jgi:putative heme-binding domain-containing protein
MSFDNRGRKFVCSNSDHIQLILYEDRYAARNPYYAMPSPRLSIAVDGPAAEVYRISPDEPWRVIRTRWRVAGQVPGPIEGGGRASGYFTGATGITLYRGNAFPEEFVGDAFIADCGSNLVHRKKLRPDGVGLRAERPADEQKVEFLASTDNWFRPVQMANAPDGALYIADMYREVIEHPWSLPESIKKHLDLNSGNDRGRIYRLVPENFQQPKRPRLGQASTAELVATLEHANGWHRDTAARLLYERQDKAAEPLLSGRIRESRTPWGRLHALSVLDAIHGLSEADLTAALADSSGVVRTRAVLLAEGRLKQDRVPEHLVEQIVTLARDPDPLTRYQLAFTLGTLSRLQRVKTAAAMMTGVPTDGWTRLALLNSVDDGAAELLTQLAANNFDFPGCAESLPLLAQLIGARNRSSEVALVLDRLSTLHHPWFAIAIAARLAEGLERSGSSLLRADATNQLRPVFALAKDWATNDAARPSAAGDPRGESIRLLGFGSYDDAASTLLGLLDAKFALDVQEAALLSLARFKTPQVAAELLSRWTTFGPPLRREVVETLLKRTDRITALLLAVEQGVVRPAELSVAQLNFLRTHRDEGVRQRANEVLGKVSTATRQEVVDDFLSALSLTGNASHGQIIYQERCASCHRLGREGYALGPDLASAKTAGKEKLLVNILDPNREVAPNYLAYLVETRDGESLVGLIINETATTLTVRQAFGKESALLRSNLQRLESQKLSLMPEGLEVGLSPQGLADLLEFVVAGEAP